LRTNQVTIKIERFNASAPNGEIQRIEVYADANNIYEALAAAYYEALSRVSEGKRLPVFGDRMSTVQDAFYGNRDSIEEFKARHLTENYEER